MSKTYTKEQLKSDLHKGTCTVSFKKLNGETRIMECTLQFQVLNEVTKDLPTKKTDTVKKENPNTLSVWDLNANGWRSFRVDRVFDIERPETKLELDSPL